MQWDHLPHTAAALFPCLTVSPDVPSLSDFCWVSTKATTQAKTLQNAEQVSDPEVYRTRKADFPEASGFLGSERPQEMYPT